MTRYWFRGGPGDPVMFDVPGSPPTVKRAHPEDMSAAMSQGPVGDETPPVLAHMRHTAYYRVRTPEGNEYWTADLRATVERAQRPVRQRLDHLERELAAEQRLISSITQSLTTLGHTVDALSRSLAALHDEQQQGPDVRRLAERFERMLEVNNLWDGS